ncbi:MAG TPA: LOG family protein, partial [Blastocatellia bacterium]|nr:LOG family protein [Blastocatellia bacterium]
ELSDAFISLPGGLGTIEETAEMATWAQLGIHRKPSGLLNVAGYFDGLLAFLDHAVQEGFLSPANKALFVESTTVDGILDAVAAYAPPHAERWITRDET